MASKKGELFTKAEVLMMTENAGKAACLMWHKHFWYERLQSLRGGARRKIEGFDWRTLKGHDQPTESFVDQSTSIFNKPVIMIRLIVLAMWQRKWLQKERRSCTFSKVKCWLLAVARDVCPDRQFFKVPATLHELVQGIYKSRGKNVFEQLYNFRQSRLIVTHS